MVGRSRRRPAAADRGCAAVLTCTPASCRSLVTYLRCRAPRSWGRTHYGAEPTVSYMPWYNRRARDLLCAEVHSHGGVRAFRRGRGARVGAWSAVLGAVPLLIDVEVLACGEAHALALGRAGTPPTALEARPPVQGCPLGPESRAIADGALVPAQSPSSRPGVTSLKNAPFCLRHPLGGATARHPASWGRGCWPRSALRTWDKVSVPLRAQRAAKARPQATAEVADPKAFRARRDGDVFAWGRSSEGQLGSPPQEGTGTVAAPHRVAALQGAAIVDVACGATHSAFVTAGVHCLAAAPAPRRVAAAARAALPPLSRRRASYRGRCRRGATRRSSRWRVAARTRWRSPRAGNSSAWVTAGSARTSTSLVATLQPLESNPHPQPPLTHLHLYLRPH
eukprot:scaffold104445_cov48-Phaeocystis_antarctica.AAC.1